MRRRPGSHDKNIHEACCGVLRQPRMRGCGCLNFTDWRFSRLLTATQVPMPTPASVLRDAMRAVAVLLLLVGTGTLYFWSKDKAHLGLIDSVYLTVVSMCPCTTHSSRRLLAPQSPPKAPSGSCPLSHFSFVSRIA